MLSPPLLRHDEPTSMNTRSTRALSGSPSPLLGPKRRRLGSDDEGTFLLDVDDAAKVQAAIEESLQQDIQRRLESSLAETRADLESQFPEETKDGFKRARQRANSELSDFVRSREATPLLGPRKTPQCSPGLVPACSPSLSAAAEPLFLPPPQNNPVLEVSAVSELTADAYSHDGLLDHEQLMMAIYASQGLDFAAVQGRAQGFLDSLGLRPHDMGVMNVDEGGNTMINQCFYLSLARGYLGQEATWPDTSELALKLKRAIEAAVLAERPNWAGGSCEVGDEPMAFADFLPIAMKANSGEDADLDVLAELAVCVLDSTSGQVEVYLGSKYDKLESEEAKERNLALLWYTPGHYQTLVNIDEMGSKVWMTYKKFKELLVEHGVMYIETTE